MGLNLNYNRSQTPLNDEEKDGLKILSINTREELDEFEHNNIETAIYHFQKKELTIDYFLTEQFVKNLHLKMFGDVWNWAGIFRKSDKNIGIPWIDIPTEMKKLLDNVRYWLNKKTFSEDEIAIRFKHRCVSIHPFSNGNGRHSRLLADIMREKIFSRSFFSWGETYSSNKNLSNLNYIKALKEADKGDYKKLLEFSRS